ncbi:MAG: efflux RND transporter periplasmic adaptor subunit [Pirellulales bacterium]
MQTTLITLAAVLALTGPEGPVASPSQQPLPAEVTVPCEVWQIQEAQVPAEEAGRLVAVYATEGKRVKKDAPLAQIDDTLAQSQRDVALFEKQVADAKATNDVDVRYATAAANFANAEHQKALETNQINPRTVTEIDVRRFKLAFDKAYLGIEQAKRDMAVAKITAQGKAAELKAATDGIGRRLIKAPFDGEVVQVYTNAGEWVKPGDPVAHLVRLDKLQIKAFVKAEQLAPKEVADRAVTVEVQSARGRRERYQGKITFVSPMVLSSGEFRVLAVVENPDPNSDWLLRPGLIGKMTIHFQ